jgi:hypothetical protein
MWPNSKNSSGIAAQTGFPEARCVLKTNSWNQSKERVYGQAGIGLNR